MEAFDAEYYILSHGRAISKEEFHQEVTMLRTIAKYTAEYKGEQLKITEAYKTEVNRELTEDELQVIGEFVNGY